MSTNTGETGHSAGFRTSAYLFFGTGCEAAFRHYEACGLGRIGLLVRYGDAGMPVVNEEMRGRVMHARFDGPGFVFHGSDNDDAESMRGAAMLLEATSLEDATRFFERLAEGGTATVPLGPAVWGAHFGMLIDRAGVRWMVNCEAASTR